MSVRFTLLVYFTFLVSGVLFLVAGILSLDFWSIGASVVFLLGVVLAIIYLEWVREEEDSDKS